MRKKKQDYTTVIGIVGIMLLIGAVTLINSHNQQQILDSQVSLEKEIDATQNLILQQQGINLTNRAGYYNGLYFVVLTRDASLDYVITTSFHEIGHHFEDTYLNSRQVTEWNSIHQNSSSFTTEYSKTKANEDFAESFESIMTYCYNDAEVKNLTEDRQEYFNKNVRPYFRVCDG